MKIPNINKLSKASQLSLLAIVILLGAVFVTVNSALQSQSNSSHASGSLVYQNGNYYCYYIGLFLQCSSPTPTPVYHYPTPTPTPPTILQQPTCAPPPLCYRNGVLICLLPQGGWCNVTPTPISAQPTPTPTRIPSAPTATPTPVALPTVAMPTSHPTAVPTSAPLPTAIPGDTVLNLSLGLHGLGTAGDSAAPNSDGNMNPLRQARTVTVTIFDSQNQQVASQQGRVQYDSASGRFIGNVDLGSQFTSGVYTIKIQTSQYLRVLVHGIQTITAGQTNIVPSTTLVAGDINGDNQINILDYNILMGCYSDLLPAVSCTSENNVLSDLNDDGNVNQFDYNLFLRELSNVSGD